MNPLIDHWKGQFAERLSRLIGASVSIDEIVSPPDIHMGDLAFGCFRLSKERKQSPATIAQELAQALDISQTDIASVEAAGPYVNVRLALGDVVHRVVREIEVHGSIYAMESDATPVMLEYMNVNTHKEIHIGHLRNAVLGVAIRHLLIACGAPVTAATYHGDIGAHVAKCLWQVVIKEHVDPLRLTFEQVDTLLTKLPLQKRNGKWMGEMYTAASRALADETIDQTQQKEVVSHVLRSLEAHDPAWDRLWQETRRWCLDEMAEIFTELGVVVDRQYLESEVVDRGQEMVDVLLKKHIATYSEGAAVVNLEDKKLGVFLVRKSDGTSLYATKDLALAELKHKEYPFIKRSLILVDSRQSLYFKQLFATLELLEFSQKFEHIGYEFVTLKSGAMSSREGNIVTYQSLRDALVTFAREGILVRHPDWNEGKVVDVSWKLAMGGMKFAFLKQDSESIITLDLEQALSFEGVTGPYCQYAAVRLGSILKKADFTIRAKQDLTRGFDHVSEKMLALKLASFPSVVHQAAKELRPAKVAQWCYETSQAIHTFYRDVPILESAGLLKEGRLRLAACAKETLAQGLALLGIDVPEEM